MVVKATAHLSISAVKQVAKVCAVYDMTDADSPPAIIDSTAIIEALYLTWFQWRDMCRERRVNRTEGPSSAVTSGTSTAALPSLSLVHF